ncbi:MAG: hypothetical protein PHG05_04540 [Candidatus Nanoarchaeia archaeon]|nr:hypothetical protein [Candidatus Nanoarchaeia archaeon]
MKKTTSLKSKYIKEVKINGLGTIVYAEGRKLIELMGKEMPITAEQLAWARMECYNGKLKAYKKTTNIRKDDNIQYVPYGHIMTGSFVREGVVCDAEKPDQIYLVRDCPIFKNPERAVESWGKCKEYLLDKKERDKFREELDAGVELGDIFVLNSHSINIDVSKFKSNELAKWLFRNRTEEYGEFLTHSGIDVIDLIIGNWSDNHDRPCIIGENQCGIYAGGIKIGYIPYNSNLCIFNFSTSPSIGFDHKEMGEDYRGCNGWGTRWLLK